jgi:zinc protease
MQKGTMGMAFEEFSDTFENTGSTLFSEVGEDHIVLGCKFLSKFADSIVPLFWDMVRSPALREKELAMIKRETIAALAAELSDPMTVASKHFYKHLCGPGHPVGRTHTLASIKKISLADVVRQYRLLFSPAYATLACAGDFDAQTCGVEKWEPLFESWNAAATPALPDVPAIPAVIKTSIRLVDKPDLTQASIIIGHPIPAEMHENRNHLALANFILGGGNFSSRLMERVRSNMGRAYSIASQISCTRTVGIFTIVTSTRNSQLREMMRSVLDVYNTFCTEGISGEDLKKAQQYAVGNMAFQMEGIGNITEKLLWLKLYGRDRSYIENFTDTIRSMGLDTVNKAIQDHLYSQHHAITVVGNKKEILQQVTEFGETSTVFFRSLE